MLRYREAHSSEIWYEGLKSSRFSDGMFEKQVAASNDVNAWSGHACRQRKGAENRNQKTVQEKDRNGTEPEGNAGGRRQEAGGRRQEAGGNRTKTGERGGKRGQIEELELLKCLILSMTCTLHPGIGYWFYLGLVLSGQVASHFNYYCYYLQGTALIIAS